MPSFVLGLVWKNADASCTEEPWQYFDRESLPAALAAARRDGIAGAFGRTFLGVATVESANAEPWTSRPIDPTRAPSHADLDDQIRASGIDLVPWGEPARAGAPLESIEQVPWWQFECAFGTGTLAGIELRRCAALDPEVAAASAELAGECIAHQMTLYSVTPAAIAAIAELLQRPTVSSRKTLAAWLDVVAKQASATPRDEPEPVLREKLRKKLQKGGMPDWMIGDIVERGVRHDAAVRACRQAFAARAATFEELARAGLIGKPTTRLVRSLAH